MIGQASAMAPLSGLPKEVVDPYVWHLVWRPGWHVANLAFTKHIDHTDNDTQHFKDDAQKAYEALKGLGISMETIKDIQEMTKETTWLTVRGYLYHKRQRDDICQRIKQRGELSSNLLDRLNDLVRNHAEHVVANHSKSESVRKHFEAATPPLIRKLYADKVDLTDIVFDEDKAEILEEGKDGCVTATIKIDNLKGFGTRSTAQEVTFTSIQTTRSTNTAGYNYTVNAEAGIRVLPFAAKVAVGTTMSHSTALGIEESKTVKVKYAQTIETPPHTSEKVQCVVQSVKARVPFTAYVHIDGVQRTFSGVWEGVLQGSLTQKTLKAEQAKSEESNKPEA